MVEILCVFKYFISAIFGNCCFSIYLFQLFLERKKFQEVVLKNKFIKSSALYQNRIASASKTTRNNPFLEFFCFCLPNFLWNFIIETRITLIYTNILLMFFLQKYLYHLNICRATTNLNDLLL